jgi:hypothetical protein
LGICGAGAAEEEVDQKPGVDLTVYNQDFAVVKERRLMQLAEGKSVVKFPEVAATIVPETVQLTSLHPGAVKVIEQNYEFDLVNADKLLDKYVDRPIGVVNRDGSLLEGTLLSKASGHLVLSNAEGVHLVSRGGNVKDIRFASLPEGLLTRPTLVWKVRADQGGEQLVRVAYAAASIDWEVDYRAVASADEKTVDLSGWVTITNNSGKTFEDAGLKLMAGDLHLVEPTFSFGVAFRRGPSKGKGPAFEEKSFADYHLYTLGRRTTLANAQTKQIELLKIEGVPVVRRYLYRPNRPESMDQRQRPATSSTYGTRVATVLEFENSKKTHPDLGIPLPKGPFRVYQRDADGEAEFVGRDAIDHTPKDEPVRVRIGYAFDLAAECVQTANRQEAGEKWNEQDWKITLRNHKDEPVSIAVEDPLTVVDPREGRRNWEILRHSHEYKEKDYRTLEYAVEVPANSQEVISYTVRFTW